MRSRLLPTLLLLFYTPWSAQAQLRYEGVSYGSGLHREYSCRLGWIPQSPPAHAVTDVCRSNELPFAGESSLKLQMDFSVSPDGETFLDLRMNPLRGTSAPANLDMIPLRTHIWVPPGAGGDPMAPTYVQIGVKDSRFRSFYGSGVNVVEGAWNTPTVTPSTGPPPPGGYMDEGFDPTAVLLLVVKVGRGPRDFAGSFFLDEFVVALDVEFTVDFEASQWDNLDAVVNVCANTVIVRAVWYMENRRSTVIAPDPSQSPTDEELREAIRQARARMLDVVLNPVVEVKDGSFRGDIDPADIDAWFESYERFLNHFAGIAAENDVSLFCVGSELKSLSDERHRDKWDRVIDAVRTVYVRDLTYHANWDEAPLVSFWDRIDLVGIDAFFPLTVERDPTLDELVAGWNRWLLEIEKLQARINKPVALTEIGYTSRDFCGRQPFNPNDGTDFNGACQARAYEAAFTVFSGRPWLAGMFFWAWETWPAAGGSGDRRYTPQGKPAEQGLAAFYCTR